MELPSKYNSFHIIKAISGEISLNYTNQNTSKKMNKIIKTKNTKKKNFKKNNIKNDSTKKIESKLENIIITKKKKEFIPLPLINNTPDINEIISSLNPFKIYRNSFSYLNENNNIINTINDKRCNSFEERNNNIDKYSLTNKLRKSINQFYKNNFICKMHPNNKYIAYCITCNSNICQDCLTDDTNHTIHKINFLKDIIPTEKIIKNIHTLLINSKYYLEGIRNVIIEIYNDLLDFYEKEKDYTKKYYIKDIQKQLIKGYKFFYKTNYYQLKYAKNIINCFCNCKDLKFLNYQIIKNFKNIRINSVKIPDIYDQHIILRARTMIEFMLYNSNNILNSSDSNFPLSMYNYESITNIENYLLNDINFDELKSFGYFVKKPELLYETKFMFNNKIDISIQKENNIKNIISKINENKKNIENINEKEKMNKLENFENNINNIINNRQLNIIEKSNEFNFTHKRKDKLDKNIYININTREYSNNILNNIHSSININIDSIVKNYIFSKLPIPCPDEVEYKENIRYSYFDKSLQKKIRCMYDGEFKKNTFIRHGRGLFIWEDNEYYLGYWENDKREGEGTTNYSNGDIYKGNYKCGKKEGKGIYTWSNGDTYDGDWKNDMKDGEGKYNCHNGDKYIGVFKMDKIEGNGLYVWANKNKYKGQFKNNEIEGKGILKYICGNCNKGGKEVHSRITFPKRIKKKEVSNDNQSNNEKKYIEIITCDRNNISKINTNVENNNNNINSK